MADDDHFHLGDCFPVAQGFAEHGIFDVSRALRIPVVTNEKSQFRIVHGLPIGRNGLPKGLRYWHAWVEFTMPGIGVTVWDYSNGLEVKMMRDEYYRGGTLDEDHVWRYTPAEAKRWRRKSGRCGPWVPGYLEMEAPELQGMVG